MRHRSVGSNAVGSSSCRADAVIDFFAAYTAAVTYDVVSIDRITTKITPSPWGYRLHLIHGFLGPPSHLRKRNLDLFTHFCRAHESDQQTDTQTDHAT